MSANAKEPTPDYRPVPGSRLGMVLSGLDPQYALSEFVIRQNTLVKDKELARKVIEDRYGLFDGQLKSVKQVAARLGVTVSAAMNAEGRAMLVLDRIRNENRPEKAADRPDIHGVDDAFLMSRIALSTRGRISAPEYRFPDQYEVPEP
jgi:hypothetical protein